MAAVEEYPNPFTQDHLTYGALIRKENRAKIDSMSAYLRERLGTTPGLALAVTGSHARLEAGVGSNLETILFCTNGTQQSADAARAIALIAPARQPSSQESTPEDNFEIKNIDAHAMYRYCNRPHSTFPGRITASAFVHGDESVYSAAKEKLYGELRGTDGADALRALRTRTKEFREIMLTGRQRFNQGTILAHFNLDEGVAHYDPKSKLLGIKAGPLRYLQVRTLRETLRAARAASDEDGWKILFETPAPITERIKALTARGITGFTDAQCETVCDTYSYFLAEYHREQERYWRYGEKEIALDAPTAKERIRDFAAILQHTVIVP